MVDISSLKPSVLIRPPKIIIYGKNKIGKSDFSSKAPNPVVMDLENGMDSFLIAKHKVKTFNQALDFMRDLYQQQHDFEYLVVDSADWLEGIMIQELCKTHDAKTISDKYNKAMSFGNGERMLLNMWKTLLTALDCLNKDKNMGIILIAHNQIKKFEDPLTETYDQHSIKLEKKTAEKLKEWADCILFATTKVVIEPEKVGYGSTVNRGKEVGRVLYTEGRPSFEAGNRFNLPPELPLSWDAFYKNYNKYIESLKKLTKDTKDTNKDILIEEIQANTLKELVTPERLNKILKDYNLNKLEDMTLCDYNNEYDKLRLEMSTETNENNFLNNKKIN